MMLVVTRGRHSRPFPEPEPPARTEPPNHRVLRRSGDSLSLRSRRRTTAAGPLAAACSDPRRERMDGYYFFSASDLFLAALALADVGTAQMA